MLARLVHLHIAAPLAAFRRARSNYIPADAP
jgi:hypothetical protein